METITRRMLATSPGRNDPEYDYAHDPQSWRAWIFGDAHANTHEFVEAPLQRAPKEVACAFAASFMVSPLVSIIDKAIVQSGSGGGSAFAKAMVGACKEMVLQPRAFLGGLSFRLTVIVYFGTYAVANLAELGLDMARVRDDEKRKHSKVSAAATANIGLLAWRDSIFARQFAQGKVPKSTPFRTIGLFAVRDCATMYATFYAAPKAAEYLEKEHDVEENVAELSMALAIPVLAQIATAPVHIHAMDYFNNREATTMAQRLSAIKKEFGMVSFARGLRILPAFGIGSFSNNKLREIFIDQVENKMVLRHRITRRFTNITRRFTRPVGES